MTGFSPRRNKSSVASHGEIKNKETRLQVVVSKGGTQGNSNKVKPERQQQRNLSPVVIALRMFVTRQLLWLTISDRNIHYQRETMDLAAEGWQKAKKSLR
jgi:hypothetical protein